MRGAITACARAGCRSADRAQGTAIVSNSISKFFVRDYARMLATTPGENDRAQPSTGFQGLHAWFETGL
jgi:hypothetical protein